MTAKIKIALFVVLAWVPFARSAMVVGGGGAGSGSGVQLTGSCPSGYFLSSDGFGNATCVQGFNTYYQDLNLPFPQRVQATNTTFDTSAQSDENYGQAVFSNSVSSATNWAEYRLQVPVDIDTTTDVQAAVFIRLGGTDTATHRYVIDMAVVSTGTAYGPTSFTNAVNLDFAGDATGASGQMEYVPLTVLTNWKTSLATAAGKLWVIRFMRDGPASQDASTTNSTAWPVIRYYRTRPD